LKTENKSLRQDVDNALNETASKVKEVEDRHKDKFKQLRTLIDQYRGAMTEFRQINQDN